MMGTGIKNGINRDYKKYNEVGYSVVWIDITYSMIFFFLVVGDEVKEKYWVISKYGCVFHVISK